MFDFYLNFKTIRFQRNGLWDSLNVVQLGRAQDTVCAGIGRPNSRDDFDTRDGIAESHNSNIFRHDAVRVLQLTNCRGIRRYEARANSHQGELQRVRERDDCQVGYTGEIRLNDNNNNNLSVCNNWYLSDDKQVEGGRGDEQFRHLWCKVMNSLCENHLNMKEQGLRFVDTVSRLMERLLQYRDIIHSESQEHRMLCIVNLLEFYSEINREEMYIRYVNKLCELHLECDNYTEAAYSLRLHSQLLAWSDKTLPPLLKSQRYHLRLFIHVQLLYFFYYWLTWTPFERLSAQISTVSNPSRAQGSTLQRHDRLFRQGQDVGVRAQSVQGACGAVRGGDLRLLPVVGAPDANGKVLRRHHEAIETRARVL